MEALMMKSLLCGALVLCAFLPAGANAREKIAGEVLSADGSLKVTSTDFEANGKIPHRFSAYGDNASPEIAWTKGPEGTKSYALIMEDPDAKSATPFVHWVLFNIPANVTKLGKAAALPEAEGSVQGLNARGSPGYFGPKPPDTADHHYHFQVFALDTELDLKADAGRDEVLDAAQGHVLARGDLVGIFRKPGGGGA
jgi:Raf kinase inhibitor-like YbhB/YbcL family protein